MKLSQCLSIACLIPIFFVETNGYTKTSQASWSGPTFTAVRWSRVSAEPIKTIKPFPKNIYLTTAYSLNTSSQRTIAIPANGKLGSDAAVAVLRSFPYFRGIGTGGLYSKNRACSKPVAEAIKKGEEIQFIVYFGPGVVIGRGAHKSIQRNVRGYKVLINDQEENSCTVEPH